MNLRFLNLTNSATNNKKQIVACQLKTPAKDEPNNKTNEPATTSFANMPSMSEMHIRQSSRPIGLKTKPNFFPTCARIEFSTPFATKPNPVSKLLSNHINAIHKNNVPTSLATNSFVFLSRFLQTLLNKGNQVGIQNNYGSNNITAGDKKDE